VILPVLQSIEIIFFAYLARVNFCHFFEVLPFLLILAAFYDLCLEFYGFNQSFFLSELFEHADKG